MTSVLTYSLSFESDWHIGSGGARHGDADSLVVRDADGFPFVPAKTLTGVWRDACEQVATGLDKHDGKATCWHAWVDWLFGTQPAIEQQHDRRPGVGRVSIRPAHLDSCLRLVLNHLDHAVFKDALTWLKPGVEIDHKTGQALQDHLRFEEVVRSGTVLSGSIELDCGDPMRIIAEGLLWAGARILRRIGGKRRRGLGCCRLEVAGLRGDRFYLDCLSSDPGSVPVAEQSEEKACLLSAPGSQQDTWIEVPLTIDLKLPVVVPARTLGNVVTCRADIPGTMLLGPVLQCLAIEGIDLFPHVAVGHIQMLDGTPEIGGVRGLPVPMALFYEKGGAGLAVSENVKEDKTSGDAGAGNSGITNRLIERLGRQQLKGYRAGYVGGGDLSRQTLPTLAKSPIESHTHNTVDDKAQCPTEDVGGVYTYEALSPGTRWRSVLRLHPDVAEFFDQRNPGWRKCLGSAKSPQPLRLGVAKKDDYGAALMYVADVSDSNEPRIDGARIVVWLTSDLLLRDKRLRPTTDADTLTEYLGAALGGIKLKRDKKADTLAFVAQHARRDGWQFRWNRPRPSTTGFAAGSCFAFQADCAPVVDALRRVQYEGLGERRAEGYGQLLLNPPWLMEALAKWKRAPAPSSSSSVTSALKLDTPLTQLLEKVAWRQWITDAAFVFAASESHRQRLGWQGGTDQPSNSQLGNLRQVLAIVDGARGVAPLQAWMHGLRNLDEHHARKKKWAKALDHLATLADQPETIWTWLREVSEQPPSLTKDSAAHVRQALQPYAVRSLLTACIRAEIKARAGESATKQNAAPTAEEVANG